MNDKPPIDRFQPPVDPMLPPPVDYESAPLGRVEYMTAVIHFYRGEMTRVATWRQRLDQTTNWSVVATAAVMSFSFGSPTHSHVVILLGNLLLLVLLGMEARRFRFFDVWRARLRKLEENFFAPILARQPQSPEPAWGALVAADLFTPHFKITYFQAFRRRLMKNYILIYLVTFSAWFVKVMLHEEPATDMVSLVHNMSVGPVHGTIVATVVGVFYSFLLVCVVFEATHTVDGENWGLSQPMDTIDQ